MDTSEQAIILLREGSRQSESKGLQLLYTNEKLHKRALFIHRKYPGLPISWEDLHSESVLRIYESIKKGGGPKKRGSASAFIYSICRNICEEYKRSDKRFERTLEVLSMQIRNKDSCIDQNQFDQFLGQLSERCRLLLWHRYLDENATKAPKELSKIMKQKGFEISATSIPVSLSRCRYKLRSIIGDHFHLLFKNKEE